MGLKKVFACFYHAPNIFVRVTKYRARKQLCSNTLKRSKLNIFVSLKEKGSMCCKQLWLISETRFGSWFLKSVIMTWTFLHRGVSMQLETQKGIRKKFLPEFPILSVFKLPLCALLTFINMNTYVLKEGRNFKL